MPHLPLVVHGGEKTTWHQVVAFGEDAERLRDTLAKGEKVSVVGYLHEREIRTKEGKPKTVRKIYVAAVKKQ